VRAAALRVLGEPGFRGRASEIAAAFARLDAGREILAALDALAEGGDVGPAPEKLAPVQRKPA
jgi:hypothetical protein